MLGRKGLKLIFTAPFVSRNLGDLPMILYAKRSFPSSSIGYNLKHPQCKKDILFRCLTLVIQIWKFWPFFNREMSNLTCWKCKFCLTTAHKNSPNCFHCVCTAIVIQLYTIITEEGEKAFHWWIDSKSICNRIRCLATKGMSAVWAGDVIPSSGKHVLPLDLANYVKNRM